MSNTIGNIFTLTTFGESHGTMIGGVIDGCPSNVMLDRSVIQSELDRRKPGKKRTSQRKEGDKVEFISGIFEGKTTGTPLAFLIQNVDAKSKDYKAIKSIFRPSHADYTYQKKYGIRDYRGGGRSSARETTCRVVAGAIAKQLLSSRGILVEAFITQIGDIKYTQALETYNKLSSSGKNRSDFLEKKFEQQALDKIDEIRKQGDSIGARVTGFVSGLEAGIGEPIYHKLDAELAKAMLSINATKGFEMGSGFEACAMKGSQHNDVIIPDTHNKPIFSTNHAGGVLGGISNGDVLYFNVAFKPTATIFKPQSTMTIDETSVEYTPQGRHDACLALRAPVIVESMAAMVILDFMMIHRAKTLFR